MKRLIVIEGADGVGKSTLAAAIASEVRGNVIHLTYDKAWSMEDYHEDVIIAADSLSVYQPVILDRWAPSEAVYGKVFRKGESYDTQDLIQLWKEHVTWVYCRNDSAAKNHLKNKAARDEMFDSMEVVAEEYDRYVQQTNDLNWNVFDFDKNDTAKFIKNLVREDK